MPRLQICVFALLLSGAPLFAATFPLPIPTRPTSFPLLRPVPQNPVGDSSTTVVAWGRNDYGQATVPAGLRDVVQVSAGSNVDGYRYGQPPEWGHTIALKRDGTVVAWGRNSSVQATVPADLVDVVQVSPGYYHTLALKRDGTVVAWGRNDYGQSTVPADLVDVVQVSPGYLNNAVLKRDGTVVAWGYNYAGQATVPAGLVDVVQVSTGDSHTAVLKRDGTVVAWGYNAYGKVTVPAGLVDVVQVSAGYDHTVALRRDGTVVAWGNNANGQTAVPAGLGDVVQVAAGNKYTVALKRDGTVVAWGRNDYGQATVPAGLVDVVQVSPGEYHAVALKVNQGLTVAAGGTAWTVDTAVTHDGLNSLKAQTTDGQSSWREYTVTGPAVVDFWWKVSSEELYDTFSYSVNGVNQETISGEVDWTYRTLTLPEAHAIRWTYTKDESGAIGQDAGWLDDFVVYPATGTLQVSDGSTALDGEATVDFGSADTGSTGFSRSLTFANKGYVPLVVQLSLPEGLPFTFEDGSAVYELLLGRNESLDVPVLLSTQGAGTRSAQLAVLAPDSTISPPTITLTGYVRGPDIGVAQGGSSLTSGQTFDMGLTPRTVEFTISNNANVGNLVISAISATGNFQVIRQPATTIPAQGSTTFKVLAQSTATGVQSGSVSITSNAGNLAEFNLPLSSKTPIAAPVGITDGSVANYGTGGAAGWEFATMVLPSGQSGSAFKTGVTPNSGGSVLEFTTHTAGVVSWNWKVSTQENFDWLLCEVDGQESAGISTKNGAWQTQVVQVPAGANVRWVYRKDASGSVGEDAGYLADVEFRSLAANQSFGQWAQTHGVTDPQQRMPKSGMQAMFGWLGGFRADGEITDGTSKVIIVGERLTYRYPVSKTADGTQQILFSPDMSSWTTRRISQRVVSEDADRMVIEATAPSGTKGFFKAVGKTNQ